MLHRPDRSTPQYAHRPSTQAQQARADAIRALVREKTRGFRDQKEQLLEQLLKPKEEPKDEPKDEKPE